MTDVAATGYRSRHPRVLYGGRRANDARRGGTRVLRVLRTVNSTAPRQLGQHRQVPGTGLHPRRGVPTLRWSDTSCRAALCHRRRTA